MSTIAAIGIETHNGTVKSIIIDGDGTFDTVAPILKNHYANEESIMSLIKLGNLRKLGTKIGDAHDGEIPSDTGWCVALKRDCGVRSSTKFKTFASAYDFFEHCMDGDTECVFLFKNGKWLFKEITFDTFASDKWGSLIISEDKYCSIAACSI